MPRRLENDVWSRADAVRARGNETKRINPALEIDFFLFNLKFRAHLLFKFEDAVWFFRVGQKKANICLHIFV